MFSLNEQQDTICAICTAPGVGGISVLRISGNQALAVARKVCSFIPASPESHRVYYGIAREDDIAIDEVLATYFMNGRSFTGEETIEVSCHGGTEVSRQMLGALERSGARLARPGEFTFRSFMNGRIDLVQAESVLSLIESQSAKASRLALRQLRGELSAVMADVEDKLTWLLAQLEASIDFSTEDIEIIEPSRLHDHVGLLQTEIQRLIASYKAGRIVSEGLQIALVGPPNVGKSSLLNALVGEERAIVTEVAGTTRDLVEGRVIVKGIPVTFVDTAGLRETEDQVEIIGIERAWERIAEADVVFYLVDLSREVDATDLQVLGEALEKGLTSEKLYLVGNKQDVCGDIDSSEFKKVLINSGESHQLQNIIEMLDNERFFVTSAKNKTGLDAVSEVVGTLASNSAEHVSATIMQARHFELLLKIDEGLSRSAGLIEDQASPEFIAFELKDCLLALHELLGKEFNDEVLDRVFKEFCLGK